MASTNTNCRLCGFLGFEWTVGQYKTFVKPELVRSAQSGCKFCGYLSKAIAPWEPLPESQKIKLDRSFSNHSAKGEHPLTNVLSREGKGISYFRSGATVHGLAPEDSYKIEIYSGYERPRQGDVIQYRDIPSSPRSEETWRFIRHQFENCRKNHELCLSHNESVLGLPKRLLRIDGSKARVIDVPEGLSDQYVALSYSWGEYEDHKSTLKLTKETARRLQNGVLVADLAQTLRDAIEVTVHLGMDLIWIDALCIVQGDEPDWIEESAKMADIYGGAFLVILAASCSSVADSFLNHARDPIITLDEELNIKARRVNNFGHHGHATGRVDDPIDRRAWTLQEKLLSTRIIRYSATEVQWNCAEERCCECGQPPVADGVYVYSYRALLRSLGDPNRAWNDLVEDYSKRLLTNPDDMLPALSGISRRMAYEINSEYIAGLWIEAAPLCLMWRTDLSSEPFPAEYLAPTFSWASTRRSVTFQNVGLDTVYMTILSTECWKGTSDPFGRVTAASLEIEGALMPAVLDLYGPKDQLQISGAGGYFIFELDGPLVEHVSSSGVATAQRSKLATPADVEMKGVPVHFWPLVAKEPKSSDYVEIFGLILGRAPEAVGDGYERLGFARKWLHERDLYVSRGTVFQLF